MRNRISYGKCLHMFMYEYECYEEKTGPEIVYPFEPLLLMSTMAKMRRQ